MQPAGLSTDHTAYEAVLHYAIATVTAERLFNPQMVIRKTYNEHNKRRT